MNKPTCPLCGRACTRTLTETIRGGKKRRVYWCSVCDLGLLAGGFQEGRAEEYYKKEYRQKHSHKLNAAAEVRELFESYEPFQGDRLRLLAPYGGKGKTLLELGCSAGMFLYHARRHFSEVTGVDYDAPAAAYAAKKCKCKTYSTHLGETPIKKGTADVVCAFQTLEHVEDPVGFIRTAGEYVKPGGTIAIEVPNLYDVLVSLYDLPNHHEFYFHEAHLWYFSEKSLLKTMRQAGFEGNVYFLQDYNVINHLHWADMDVPSPRGVTDLGAPALPFRKSAPKTARVQITRELARFDAAYKKILAQYKRTSNLFFIGKKKRA